MRRSIRPLRLGLVSMPFVHSGHGAASPPTQRFPLPSFISWLDVTGIRPNRSSENCTKATNSPPQAPTSRQSPDNSTCSCRRPSEAPHLPHRGQDHAPHGVRTCLRIRRHRRFLRREGLYSSLISEWRKQLDAGVLQSEKPGKRSANGLPNKQRSRDSPAILFGRTSD